MITKSGTNRLHGTLWEFNRNDELTQSYDAIAGKSVTSPRLNRNQFGANIGGPVWIPKALSRQGQDVLLLQLGIRLRAQGAVQRLPHRSPRGHAHRRLPRSGERTHPRCPSS